VAVAIGVVVEDGGAVGGGGDLFAVGPTVVHLLEWGCCFGD
jgi:hypothetical protein